MKCLERKGPDARERRQMQWVNRMVVRSKKCRLLLIAMWIGTVFFFSSPNPQAAEVWDKVFSELYTETSGHNQIRAMAEFQGTLYVVAGKDLGYPQPGSVYRLVSISAGCGIWDDVTPPWSAQAGNGYMAMLVYDNRLYVGNGNGEIFRTHDGTTWIPVTADMPSGSNVPDMAEFNGKLYVVQGSLVWRLKTDSEYLSWEKVYDKPYGGTIESLEVFNGALYAGAGFDSGNGIILWKTDDGQNWTEFYSNPGGILVGHAHALKPFKGYLYLGLYEAPSFWRTDGSDGESIYLAYPGASGGPFRLLEHANRFYLGTFNLVVEDFGYPLLYFSTDGTQWSPVPGCPAESNETKSITAMESYGGDLYVATTGTDNQEIAIYRFGIPSSYSLAEVNTSVVALKERVGGIKATILQHCDDIPCLDVDPPIGPIPPTWNGWEFPLIRSILDALIAIEVPAGAEVIRELALESLWQVNVKVRTAMEIVFPLGTSDVSDIAFQVAADTLDDGLDETIGHLDDAMALCDSVSALLSSIASVTIDGCDTGVLDQVYSGQYISEWISECEEGATNHGQFVQYVARLSNDLLADEIITSGQKESLVECAAESDIGKGH